MALYFLISSLFPLVLFVLCIVTLVRGLTFPGRVRRARRPLCGRCGHEIAAQCIGADRCAECGSRYDVAGTLTLSLAKRARPGGFVVGAAWTVVMLSVTGVVSTVIAVVQVPGGSLIRSQRSASFQAIRTDGSVRTNVPGYRVEFDMSIDYRGSGPAQSGSVTLTIDTDARTTQIAVIDLPTKTWRATGGAGAGAPSNAGGVFDRDAVLALLASAGIYTDTPYVMREAEALSDSIEMLATSPQLAINQSLGMTRQSQTVTSPPPAPRWQPKSLESMGFSTSMSEGRESWSFDFHDDSSLGTNNRFNGTIEFVVESGVLDRVVVRLRDVDGGTGVLRYDPASGDTEIIGLTDTVQTKAPDARAAFTAFSDALELGASGTGMIDDLSDLTATMVQNPGHFQQQQPMVQPSGTRDGEPDGGFRGSGSGGSTMPVSGLRGASVGVLGGYAALGAVYVGGLVFIWRRKRTMQRIALAEPLDAQGETVSAVSSA